MDQKRTGPRMCRLVSWDRNSLPDKRQCFSILLCGWLGGFRTGAEEPKVGRLLTIEEIGKVLRVPVNLKDQDTFHLTIEEYLQSLISLIDEMVSRPFCTMNVDTQQNQGSARCQFGHLGRLRETASNQSIYQRCACRFPNTQPEE